MARLRRCATLAEAMQQPETMALFRRCGGRGAWDLPRVALAAAVLAHLRQDVPGASVARQIGPADPDKPETALVKPLRFRRLMEASGDEERLVALRRLSVMAGGALNAHGLAEAALDWSEDRRIRWTYDYWNANPPLSSPPASNAAPSAQGHAP